MADDAQELAAVLGPVWERNGPKLLARLEAVAGAAAAAGHGPLEDGARSHVHVLIGALGTYGWHDGSSLLLQLQEAAAGGGDLRPFVPRLRSLATALAEGPPPWAGGTP